MTLRLFKERTTSALSLCLQALQPRVQGDVAPLRGCGWCQGRCRAVTTKASLRRDATRVGRAGTPGCPGETAVQRGLLWGTEPEVSQPCSRQGNWGAHLTSPGQPFQLVSRLPAGNASVTCACDPCDANSERTLSLASGRSRSKHHGAPVWVHVSVRTPCPEGTLSTSTLHPARHLPVG